MYMCRSSFSSIGKNVVFHPANSSFSFKTISIANNVAIREKACFNATLSHIYIGNNVICEGMMIGKPIIMTHVADFELLVDKNNGFLCDWDNPLSIRDTLQKAINLTNEDLIRIGENSKNKAEKLFFRRGNY